MKNKIILMLLAFSFAPFKAQCWTSFSAGELHTVALMNNGTMWNWGWNIYGQLGDGTTVDKLVPTQIGTQTDWAKITNHLASHTLAIKNNGTLWGWGLNQSGQAGSFDNTNANGYILTPTQIGADKDWKIMVTGNKHSAALKIDGTLWTWGRNENGQLGIGNKINKDMPTKVGTDNNWIKVAAGDAHTIAVKQDGTLWSFGNKSFGELGLGNNLDKNIPTQIGSSNDWRTIATGGLHTVAVKTNGDIWSWGININGMLGDGSVNNRNYPLKIQNPLLVTEASAGGNYSMALSEGKLYNWGNNYGGQLGNGVNGNGNDVLIPTLLKCPIALGSTDIANNSNWIFYPNPAHDIINFNPNLTFSHCIAVDGKLIKIVASGYQLNTSKLVTGTYMLIFTDPQGKIISEKLLKK